MQINAEPVSEAICSIGRDSPEAVMRRGTTIREISRCGFCSCSWRFCWFTAQLLPVEFLLSSRYPQLMSSNGSQTNFRSARHALTERDTPVGKTMWNATVVG